MKISALARKELLKSKGVILMIALCSMLIGIVLHLGISMQRSYLNELMEMVGDMHVNYTNITEEQATLLKGQSEVELASLSLYLRGWGNPVNNDDDGIGMLHVSALGQIAGMKLTSGRAPQAENEAVIPPHVAELLGVKPKAGEEFDLNYRTPDGTEERLHFTVSGILQEQRMYAALDVYNLFISRTLADRLGDFRDAYGVGKNNEDVRELSLRFHKKYPPEETAVKLAERAGVTNESDVQMNEQYLTASFQDPSAPIFIGISVILLILCVAGALVVYNAYNLNIVNKVQNYGLLTVIGASKRQIRHYEYLEAFYCTVLGLPLGLFMGTVLGYFGVGIMSGISNTDIRYVISPMAYLIASIVTLAMVFIGTMRPARKASRIAPVEAIRFTDREEKMRNRKTLRKVTVNSLSRINLSRGRGRTIGIITSLTLSGILFLGFSTVAFSMLGSVDALTEGYTVGDMQVTVERFGSRNQPDPLNGSLVETIRNQDGVKELRTILTQEFFTIPKDAEEEEQYNVIVGLEEALMKEMLSKTKQVTLEDMKNPKNVIAVIPEIPSEHNPEKILAPFAVGNTITIRLCRDGEITGETVDLNIIGTVSMDDVPPYADNRGIIPMLYTLQDSFPHYGWNEKIERVILNIDMNQHDEIYQTIKALCENADLSVESHKQVKDELSRQLSGVISLVLFMLAIVAWIGIMNLIGSTYMGMERRKKEFGILLAVGLGKKGIGDLLKKEGYFISIVCTLFSSVLGLLLGCGLYQLMIQAGATYMHFKFPVIPLISLCAVYILVPLVITKVAVRKMGRFTITELLGRRT